MLDCCDTPGNQGQSKCCNYLKNGEMAQGAKVPDDLSLIPRIHTVEGENNLHKERKTASAGLCYSEVPALLLRSKSKRVVQNKGALFI